MVSGTGRGQITALQPPRQLLNWSSAEAMVDCTSSTPSMHWMVIAPGTWWLGMVLPLRKTMRTTSSWSDLNNALVVASAKALP